MSLNALRRPLQQRKLPDAGGIQQGHLSISRLPQLGRLVGSRVDFGGLQKGILRESSTQEYGSNDKRRENSPIL